VQIARGSWGGKSVRCSIKGKTIFSIIGEGLYVVPERKPSSGTILDFGLQILDSKKKAISARLVFSSKTGTPYFEVFVQTPRTRESEVFLIGDANGAKSVKAHLMLSVDRGFGTSIERWTERC
jgi:hypothetical protein